METIDVCVTDLVVPREDEELARTVLSPHLHGRLVAHHPRPDFALCRDGTLRGWVEVTRATDESSSRVEDNLQKLGRKFFSDRLTHDWIVAFERTADLRRLDQERLIEALRLQELFDVLGVLSEPNARVRRRRATHYVRDYPRVKAILDEHHVWTCSPLRPADGRTAKVLLTSQGGGGFANPETITALAEEKLTLKRKSLAELTGERHLFVLVDINDRSGASIAMGGSSPDLPTRLPEFPPWATDVWLMPLYFQIRLWHASRNSETWRTIDVDVSTF